MVVPWLLVAALTEPFESSFLDIPPMKERLNGSRKAFRRLIAEAVVLVVVLPISESGLECFKSTQME